MDKNFIKYYKNILNSISFGIFTVDREWRITFFNKVAEEITGLLEEDVIGKYCHDVFRGELCPGGCYLREAIKSKKDKSHGEVIILNKHNQPVPITITGSILTDEDGNLMEGLAHSGIGTGKFPWKRSSEDPIKLTILLEGMKR